MTKETAILRVDPDAVGPRSHIISIFDPTSVGEALAENGWTNSEAIEMLTEIARDAANSTARERMAAIKYIEDKSEKALTLAGVIRRISMESLQKDGDTENKLTADGLQLIKEGAARTMSTLELLDAGTRTTDIIDVDPVEVSHDARTRSDVPDAVHPGAPTLSRPSSECRSGSGVPGDRRAEPGTSQERSVHGSQRPNSTYSESRGETDDQGTTGGAEDERSTGTAIESGRGITSTSPGGTGHPDQRQHGQDSQDDVPATTEPPRTLERPGYCDLHSRNVPPLRSTGSPARSTPYTPGEARRRSAAEVCRNAADSNGEPSSTPDVTTPRPSDGNSDEPSRTPRISARYLPQSLAADGFPGDSTDD